MKVRTLALFFSGKCTYFIYLPISAQTTSFAYGTSDPTKSTPTSRTIFVESNSPDKCDTDFDAVAVIRGEMWAFKSLDTAQHGGHAWQAIFDARKIQESNSQPHKQTVFLSSGRGTGINHGTERPLLRHPRHLAAPPVPERGEQRIWSADFTQGTIYK